MKQGPKICQYRNDMDYCLWYKRESYNDQETSIAWYKNLWHTRKCNIIGEKYYALSSVIWLFILSFWLKFKSWIRHLNVEISNVAEHFNKYTGSQLFMSTIEIWHFLTGLKLENYYFFTFTFSRPEVRKLLLFYVFTFSRPEVRKLFRIYFFTFSRPEVGKLFHISNA